MLIIGIAQALVVFRVVAAPLMSKSNWEFIKENASTVAMMLGAVLHYLTIQIMTRVCTCILILMLHSHNVGRMGKTTYYNFMLTL